MNVTGAESDQRRQQKGHLLTIFPPLFSEANRGKVDTLVKTTLVTGDLLSDLKDILKSHITSLGSWSLWPVLPLELSEKAFFHLLP